MRECDFIASVAEHPCEYIRGVGVIFHELLTGKLPFQGRTQQEMMIARLRSDLAELGLARDEAMGETEDHVAYLCEVMRYLIAGDDVAVANLTRQREFFAQHLQPWLQAMSDAIAAHPRARFYAALAGFTGAFGSVEAQGFDMLA